VVGLQWLVMLVNVGVGVGVVMAGGDGVVVVVEVGIIVDSGGYWKGLGVGAVFERMTKMEHENERKMRVRMTIFVKWGGVVHFSKMTIFRLILISLLSSFLKNGRK